MASERLAAKIRYRSPQGTGIAAVRSTRADLEAAPEPEPAAAPSDGASEASERDLVVQRAAENAQADRDRKLAVEKAEVEAKAAEAAAEQLKLDGLTDEQLDGCFDSLAAEMGMGGDEPFQQATKRQLLGQAIGGGWRLPTDIQQHNSSHKGSSVTPAKSNCKPAGPALSAAPAHSSSAAGPPKQMTATAGEKKPAPEPAIAESSEAGRLIEIGRPKFFGVPGNNLVVVKAVEWVEAHALSERGVWRRTALPSKLDAAVLTFEQELPCDFGGDSAIATGVIRRWLDLLPAGLISAAVTGELIQAGSDQPAVQAAVDIMGEDERKSLALLAIHWHHVAQATGNEMDPAMVAIAVFSSLSRSSNELPLDLVKTIPPIQLMIEHAPQMFGERTPGSSQWALLRSTVQASFNLSATTRSIAQSLEGVSKRCTGPALQAPAPRAALPETEEPAVSAPKELSTSDRLLLASENPDVVALHTHVIKWGRDQQEPASQPDSGETTRMVQLVNKIALSRMGPAKEQLNSGLIKQDLSSISASGLYGLAAGIEDRIRAMRFQCAVNPKRRTPAAANEIAQAQALASALRELKLLRGSLMSEFHEGLVKTMMDYGLKDYSGLAALQIADIDALAAYLNQTIRSMGSDISGQQSTEQDSVVRSVTARDTLAQRARRQALSDEIHAHRRSLSFPRKELPESWHKPRALESDLRASLGEDEEVSETNEDASGQAESASSLPKEELEGEDGENTAEQQPDQSAKREQEHAAPEQQTSQSADRGQSSFETDLVGKYYYPNERDKPQQHTVKTVEGSFETDLVGKYYDPKEADAVNAVQASSSMSGGTADKVMAGTNV